MSDSPQYHLGLGARQTLRQRLAELFAPARPSLIPTQYVLMVDSWEGQGLLDLPALRAGGVQGLFLRLNDISGGTHADLLFAQQWAAAKDWIRLPYFVYNPWNTGQVNFDKLAALMPADAYAVMIDAEVIYSGYSSSSYAAEFQKFMSLVRARWNAVIYTAEWFLSYLAYWPRDVSYVWAQYPSALYTSQTLTWDRLRELLTPYAAPANASKCPGPLMAWQCSGDKLILPGSAKALDVDVCFWTLSELQAFAGFAPPPTPTLTHTILVHNDGSLSIDGHPYP